MVTILCSLNGRLLDINLLGNEHVLLNFLSDLISIDILGEITEEIDHSIERHFFVGYILHHMLHFLLYRLEILFGSLDIEAEKFIFNYDFGVLICNSSIIDE
jgi:hypothetical protein